MIDELLPCYMTQSKMEISKEDGGGEGMIKVGGCLDFMVFGVMRWWLLLQAI